jgi:hypothetical protein
MHCQSRGPGASLVTTAACCPVKEGALTIRFWRARPASASIQDAYMAFPARSLPRIPVMSPMPPLQEGDALPWCHLPPACVRCCRVVSLRCRAAQWSKPPRARLSETSSPPLPLLCPLSLFASNPVIPPQIPPSVTLIPRATSSTRNETTPHPLLRHSHTTHQPSHSTTIIMASKSVNVPTDPKIKEQDVNAKLQLYGIYSGMSLPIRPVCAFARSG